MNSPDHSKCQTLLGSLSDYVDGTLSEELCEEIKPPCRRVSELPHCR